MLASILSSFHLVQTQTKIQYNTFDSNPSDVLFIIPSNILWAELHTQLENKLAILNRTQV